MKKAILLIFLLLNLACAAHMPPPDAIPGRISVVTDTKSPYWKSWINHYIPRGVNDYAHYKIVDGSNEAPYKLNVSVLNANSYVSGISDKGGVNYRTMVEVEAELLDQDNHEIWSWAGWADYYSGAASMKAIAKMIGKEMSKAGLLKPSYYVTTIQTK